VDNTSRGDKFTNLYAGKGVVSLVLPDELMPKDPITKKPFDMIFNPLGIFGRNNWGSIFELSLGKITRDVEHTYDLDLFKKKIEFINEKLIKRADPEYYESIKELLNNNLEDLRENVSEVGLYLYFSNFNNISYNSFFEEFIKIYEETFDFKLNHKSSIKFDEKLINYLRNYLGFSSTIFNNDTLSGYYETEVECYYGENYLSKLYHTSNSKYNAIAFTNSYSKTTGQPTRGRKKQGGQHISWQTTAALLSHKENNNIIKELFTFKSDSMEDKESFLMKIIKDGEYIMKDKYDSSTKKTINNALKMIGMEFLSPEEIQALEEKQSLIQNI
jgi:DNA-directed RNA polymerase beta subunit